MKQNVSRIPKKAFYLKYIIWLLDDAKQIKIEIFIKKYVKTKFADSTQNYNKKAGIPNRNFPENVC
jgi:predicted transcriptional regulator